MYITLGVAGGIALVVLLITYFGRGGVVFLENVNRRPKPNLVAAANTEPAERASDPIKDSAPNWRDS